MTHHPSSTKRTVLWMAVAVLALLHHDFWWWDTRTLVLGVVPVGLFYHCAFSVVAGLTWLLACRFAWPNHIEEWADETPMVDRQPGLESGPAQSEKVDHDR